MWKYWINFVSTWSQKNQRLCSTQLFTYSQSTAVSIVPKLPAADACWCLPKTLLSTLSQKLSSINTAVSCRQLFMYTKQLSGGGKQHLISAASALINESIYYRLQRHILELENFQWPMKAKKLISELVLYGLWSIVFFSTLQWLLPFLQALSSNIK